MFAGRAIAKVVEACKKYFPALAFLIICFPFVIMQNWDALVRISLEKTFGDLRLLTSNSECYLDGITQVSNLNCDPWGRDFNYPKIWLKLATFFQVKESHTEFIGVILILLLFFTFVLLIFLMQSKSMRTSLSEKFRIVMSTVIFCSPPSFFLAERGNIETIVFLLLLLIAFLPLRFFYFSVMIWILASNLKIYPLVSAAFMFLSPGKFRRALWCLGLGLFIFGFCTARQLSHLSKTSDYFPFDSYGSQIFSRMLCYPQTNSGLLCNPASQVFLGIATLAFVWAAIQLTTSREYSRVQGIFREVLLNSPNSRKIMITFGSTFLFTYLIGTNWDYRLILLYPITLLALNSDASAKEIKMVLMILIAPLYLSYNEWVPLQILGDLILIPLFFLILSLLISIYKESIRIAKVRN
jgi:hypothetical protein